jgi:hypothetical protein
MFHKSAADHEQNVKFYFMRNFSNFMKSVLTCKVVKLSRSLKVKFDAILEKD